MQQGSLGERLGRFLPLTDAERRALAQLEDVERVVQRGAVLRREHALSREIFVVRRGWLCSSMLLPEGNRQILSLHLPGDLAGDAALPWSTAPFTVTAITEGVVSVVEKSALRAVLEAHPRLALLLLALAQAERVMLADRLASIGRTSARARVATLLADLHARLLARDANVATDGFTLPLTQEEIGDATGLTAVHVNRMMRQLVEEGLIARMAQRVRVLDVARLTAIGNHVDRVASMDMGWLPQAG